MTALAADRSTPMRQGRYIPFAVADNVKFYKHALGVLSGGYAQPGTTAEGLLCVGRAKAQVDNTVSGHALGLFTEDLEEGVFCWAQSGTTITAADIGSIAYIVDDQTVSKTNSGQSPAGIIRNVDYAGVWVESSLALSLSLTASVPSVTAVKTLAYTAVIGDFVQVDSTAGIQTTTLPTAVGVKGQRVTVKDQGGAAATHTITVATTSSQTIDGASTLTITTNHAAKQFVSDGANWQSV